MLREWIAIAASYRDKRRFLEGHPELMDERSIAFIERALDLYREEPDTEQLLLAHRHILTDAMRRGGSSEDAVRDACVNVYGGFALDIPDWLATFLEGSGDAKLERGALERAEAEQLPAPVLAALRLLLWDTLDDERGGLNAPSPDQIQVGIADLERAVLEYSGDRYPLQHRVALIALGSAYRGSSQGAPAPDIERSIAVYEAALEPGLRDEAPLLWARAQRGLANAYLFRMAGGPTENARRGIACCEAAMEMFTEKVRPKEWALTMVTLGNLYQQHLAGGRRANIERACECYRAALRVLTLEEHPKDYAMMQNHLGIALRQRIAGDPIANAELAMRAHFEALKVYTKDRYPWDYAWTLCNLAAVSLFRPAVSTRQNIESAIRAYQEVLTIFTPDQYPLSHAMAQNNLGLAYADRPWEIADAIKHAIAAFDKALAIYTTDAYPEDRARTLLNLAAAYIKRMSGNRQRDLSQAIACYEEALRYYTPDKHPVEYRTCQLGLVWPEAERGNWPDVHDHYESAYAVETRLLREEAGEEARAALLKEGRDTALRDGYALARIGRVAEAAVAIERGRARGLAELVLIESADVSRITDEQRRARFVAARERLTAARRALYGLLRPALDQDTFVREWDSPDEFADIRRLDTERAEAYQEAHREFDGVVAEIRAAGDPADFLDDTLDERALLQAAARCGKHHALVYLVATPWGGLAVAALSPSGEPNEANEPMAPRFLVLDLADLSFERVVALAQVRLTDETLHVIGGFCHAQRGSGLKAVNLPLWQGNTFRERTQAIYESCRAFGKASTLCVAAQRTLDVPALRPLVDCPLEALDEHERKRLEATLNHLFLQTELKIALEKLAALAMRPICDWLVRSGVKTTTLIPCGLLEGFPLTAAPVREGATFADVLPSSTAPSARALLAASSPSPVRSGVYTLGDPHPTHQPLRWGEAEALSIAKLARLRGLPGHSRVQRAATRTWLLEALATGEVVSASCHGMFHVLDFMHSALLLSDGQTLTLADVLRQQARPVGLRLLILSACQTAIPDVRWQTDEVRSLAAAVVQAGTQAVLGSLWPVDDKATYLLVVRFAQEWLPNQHREAPAVALARAQRWLRTLTNRRLRAWQATALADLSEPELAEAGVAPGWEAPWHAESRAANDSRMCLAVRGWGDRYTISEAEAAIRSLADSAQQDARPFADPIYWAGFQIIGW